MFSGPGSYANYDINHYVNLPVNHAANVTVSTCQTSRKAAHNDLSFPLLFDSLHWFMYSILVYICAVLFSIR